MSSSTDWVALSGISNTAHSLYEKLLRLDKAGEDITGELLARCMGFSRADKTKQYAEELERIGAVQVTRRGVPARNFYRVQHAPPAGYTGPRTVAEWMAGLQYQSVCYFRDPTTGLIGIGHTTGSAGALLAEVRQVAPAAELVTTERGCAADAEKMRGQYHYLRAEAPTVAGVEWFIAGDFLPTYIDVRAGGRP